MFGFGKKKEPTPEEKLQAFRLEYAASHLLGEKVDIPDDIDISQLDKLVKTEELLDSLMVSGESTASRNDEAAVGVPARGSRFAGDKPSIGFYIQRSKNANTVCYEYVDADADEKSIDQPTLHPYWLDLEPSYQEKARAKGKMDDREELNVIEKKMAYGVGVSEVDGTTSSTSQRPQLKCKFVALSTHVMRLVPVPVPLTSTNTVNEDANQKKPNAFVPLLLCFIGGELCIAERAYVQASEPKHALSLPSVEYVQLVGVSVATGRVVEEKIKG